MTQDSFLRVLAGLQRMPTQLAHRQRCDRSQMTGSVKMLKRMRSADLGLA